MQMDSRLILAGRQPDVLGSYATGTEVGRRDALYDLYRDQGSGIAAGEQGALNALAQFDPQAALGVQRSRQVMNHADQANSRANQAQKWDAEKMDMLRQQARLSAADRVAGMKAEDRAVAMQELQGVLKGAATFYKQGDEAGYNQWLEKNGQDPAAYPFGAFPAHAAQLLGIMDVLAGPEPLSTPGKIQSDINRGILPPGTPLQNGPLVDMSGANFGTQPDSDGRGLVSNPSFQSVPEGVDFANATGASGLVSQISNTISDAVGLGLVDPNNERATQAMENLSTNTMITLADGVAGKPSNFLLEQFQKLASQPNSIWQGEGRTRERLNQTRAMIEQGIMMNQDVVNSSETATMRSQARSNIARLSRLLSDYDAVIESFGTRGSGGVEAWMTDTDPATWTEEQMEQAERAWGLK